MQNRTQIRRITPSDNLTHLAERAAADNHNVLWPTHLMEKGNETVGYLSLVRIAMAGVWIDSKKNSARDSVVIQKQIDSLVVSGGENLLITPCSAVSPLFPYMDRFGYSQLMATTLFVKTYE